MSDGWLLCFEEEFTSAADAKAVVGRFRRAADLYRVFVNNVFVGFGVAADVLHVPAKRLEHWIDELATQLRLIVAARLIRFELFIEALNEIRNHRGRWHG